MLRLYKDVNVSGDCVQEYVALFFLVSPQEKSQMKVTNVVAPFRDWPLTGFGDTDHL